MCREGVKAPNNTTTTTAALNTIISHQREAQHCVRSLKWGGIFGIRHCGDPPLIMCLRCASVIHSCAGGQACVHNERSARVRAGTHARTHAGPQQASQPTSERRHGTPAELGFLLLAAALFSLECCFYFLVHTRWCNTPPPTPLPPHPTPGPITIPPPGYLAAPHSSPSSPNHLRENSI